jgi:cytochrome c5
MQKTTTRRATARRFAALSLFTVLAGAPVFAQTGQPLVRAEVPYEFTVGSKVLPAGTYTFRVTDRGIQVQPASGQTLLAPILTRLGGPTEFLQDGALVFDKMDNARVLSEVWMPGTDGVLLHSTPKGHKHEFLLLTAGNPNPNLSGKAAYDQTCRRCHGPDGNGEERADKFFGTRIPKLTSAEVQGKPDAELKEIITKGSSAMPPVEIDEAGFRHRLPAQSVDAVIAYVRTLKH